MVSAEENSRLANLYDQDQLRIKVREGRRPPPSNVLIVVADAWRQMAVRYPATYAVTMTYNNHMGDRIIPVPLDDIHNDLDELHWIIDCNLYGSHVHKRDAEKRTSFIAFIENPTKNVHVHAAWRVPQDRHHEFPSVLAKGWANLPYKTSAVSEIHSDGWGEYITKDVWQHALDGDAQRFFASRCQVI